MSCDDSVAVLEEKLRLKRKRAQKKKEEAKKAELLKELAALSDDDDSEVEYVKGGGVESVGSVEKVVVMMTMPQRRSRILVMVTM